jgi:hypothetical protein
MNSISVIIPTRGRHHFLKQALESVLAQTQAATSVSGIHVAPIAAGGTGRHCETTGARKEQGQRWSLV